MFRFLLLLLMPLLATDAAAQGAIPILSAVQGQAGETEYSVTLQLLGLMTVLTLLPSILLMMTSFTRIIIVLSLLRQALGTAQTPPNQILLGIALFLTIFIMAPVFTQVYDDAIAPYSNDEMGLEAAIEAAQGPPALAELAERVGYAPHHFHRLFKRATGVTPAAYARACRAARTTQALAHGQSITQALYEAGYAGPSRFYADSEQRLGMAPGQWRRGGEGV